MDTWVWDQVGLELSDIDVEGSIETKGGSQGRDDLGDQSVQVGVGWSLNIEGSSADIIDGFVIKGDGDISVFKKSMGGEHRVVWLNDGSGNLRGWVDSETKLGLLSVVNGETLKKEGSKTRTGSSSNSVEDEETLKTGTVISELSGSVKD